MQANNQIRPNRGFWGAKIAQPPEKKGEKGQVSGRTPENVRFGHQKRRTLGRTLSGHLVFLSNETNGLRCPDKVSGSVRPSTDACCPSGVCFLHTGQRTLADKMADNRSFSA